ncbi:MAG TPA: ATP-dependent helicase, partial [Candidatus Limnocylindrales bacterium]
MLAATPSPERLLEDLNPSQREAVTATSGPLAILAGAGSGKTRVISRRAAYAIETGAVPADQILLVTFTDKAAGEMVERMASLGHRGVLARTFHAAALAQLRHFWPSRHDGAPVPAILDSKLRLLVPLVGRLPGGYRFTPSKDVADTIEWAKVRRIRPERWVREGGDRAPIPAELFARVYRDYERAKTAAGLLDFEDMLVQTVELLEDDETAASLVRSRKRWFSVDEYQDTNPLSERLLELWLGESRDLAVVGDPDQTIY